MVVSGVIQHMSRLELYKNEKPFQVYIPIPEDSPDQRITNLEFEENTVEFHDIRETEHQPTLDNNGFTVRRYPSALEDGDFLSRPVVESTYFQEMETILKQEDPSIDRIFFFDYRVYQLTPS